MDTKTTDLAERGGVYSVNDIILYAVDDVGVFEGKILAITDIRTCDVAAVEAVASAFADGVLALAQRRGLLSSITSG